MKRKRVGMIVNLKKSWNYENIANCYSIVFYNFLTLMMMLQNIDVLFFQVDQIIIFL